MAAGMSASSALARSVLASSSRQQLRCCMPQRIGSTSAAVVSESQRNFATSSRFAAQANAATGGASGLDATADSVPLSKKDEKKRASTTAKTAASAPVSSCPAGTVLTGLAVYKDRADPVALPDSEYPTWLWDLVGSDTVTTASGVKLESTQGMTKGQARAAQKRNMRLVRAAQRSEERLRERQRLTAEAQASAAAGGHATAQVSTSGAGMHAFGATSEGTTATAGAGRAEEAAAEAAAVIQTPAEARASEQAQRKALRKANREAIKARNFVKGRK